MAQVQVQDAVPAGFAPPGYDYDTGEPGWVAAGEIPQGQRAGALAHIMGADPRVTQELAMEAESLRDLYDDTRGWRSTDGRSDFAHQIADAQRQSVYFWLRHPLARNILRNYQTMIVGSGMVVNFKLKTMNAAWEAWARENDWEARYRRIVLNACMVGEQPVVVYPLSAQSSVNGRPAAAVADPGTAQIVAASRKRQAKRSHVRLFPVAEVTEVRTHEDDSEQLVYVKRAANGKEWIYAAEDVVLFPVNLTGMSPRGRPVLEPVLRLLQWIHGFVQDRVLLHAFRTRIPIIRKVKVGGTTRVGTEGAKFGTLPRPGTVVTTSMDGEEWLYPGLNLSAGDAASDHRMLTQMLAAGVNLPEFMVTSNAATANKASLAEAMDAVRPMFDELRSMFEDRFADLVERVMGERPTELRFASGEKRETLDRVRGLAMAVDRRLLSRTTATAMLGRSFQDEIMLLAAEEAELERLGLKPEALVGDGLPELPADAEDDEPDDDSGEA